jgi:hypothetical protein
LQQFSTAELVTNIPTMALSQKNNNNNLLPVQRMTSRVASSLSITYGSSIEEPFSIPQSLASIVISG